MSQVIYARVSEDLKGAVDSYATEQGVTLTAAVSDLLAQGLEAVAEAPVVADLRRRYEVVSESLRQQETKVATARSELAALRGLTIRALQQVGVCPTCQEPITGYDLLSTGTCPKCAAKLPTPWNSGTETDGSSSSSLVRAKGLNDRDVLLLLGAVGAVVALAYLAGQ